MARRRAQAQAESWALRYMPGTIPTNWQQRAECLNLPVDMFFGSSQARAIAVCSTCPVRLHCLHDAWEKETDIPVHLITGVVGGLPMTRRQRARANERSAA